MNTTATKFADNQAKLKHGKHRDNSPAPGYPSHPERGGYEASFWQEYHHEIELEKQIEDLGLQKIEEGKIPIPKKIARAMGIEYQVSPIQKAFPSAPKLPLSDAAIIKARQTGKIKQSIRWLAEWCFYLLAKFHLTLKLIGHKVIRVRT